MDEIWPKISSQKQKKWQSYPHWILHIWTSQVLNLSLNQEFWILRSNLHKNSISGWKWKKWASHWILHIWISLSTKCLLKPAILVFCFKFVSKKVLPIKNKKEHHHQVLDIWISLGTKFQLKLTILSFWTKFAKKEYFWQKTEEVNFTTEFWIFFI